MVGELLEAYRRLEHRQYLMVVCMTVSIIVTLALLVLYAQLSTANNQNLYSYLGLEANYSSISASAGTQIARLKQELCVALRKVQPDGAQPHQPLLQDPLHQLRGQHTVEEHERSCNQHQLARAR